MSRIVLLVAVSFLVAACAESPDAAKHKPPQDPPDYHGVPTDTRPPAMLDAPPRAQ
jgi:hypothetical protein